MSDVRSIILTTAGFGTKGFTFSVLSNEEGHTEDAREQFEDPEFTSDYNEDPFVVGTVYRFLGYHPDYMPDEELIRVVWKDTGGFDILDPAESDNAATLDGVPYLGATEGQRAVFHFVNGKPFLQGVDADTWDSLLGAQDDSTEKTLNAGGLSIPDVADGDLASAIDQWVGLVRNGTKMELRVTAFGAILQGLVGGLGQGNNASFFKSALNLSLGDLQELTAALNLILTGNNNLILKNVTGQGSYPRGLYFFLDDSLLGSLSLTTQNEIRLTSRSGHYIQISEDILRSTARQLLLTQGDILTRGFGVTTLPRATKTPTLLPVFETGTDGNSYLRFATPSQINDALIADLLPRLPSGSGMGSQYMLVGCFQRNIQANTVQTITQSSPSDNMLVAHNLQSVAIWCSAQSNPNVVVEILNDDIEHVKLHMPSGLSLSTFTFRLELTNA